MKRINPNTGEHFREGDARDDGYIFVSYRSIKNNDGYFREDWSHPDVFTRKKLKKKSTEEKQAELAQKLKEQGSLNYRLNPETNAPFKQGDRENGLVFWVYRPRAIRKDGSVPEDWITEEDYEERVEYHRQVTESLSLAGLNAAIEGELVRRLNPLTGKPFVTGDRRESDGWYFNSYSSRIQADGFMQEQWASPEAWLRKRIGHAYRHAIDRALERGMPFNVSIGHLVEIFPKDYRCPILGTLMEWGKGGGKRTSPSIDRIDPKKGYVEGNLVWISDRANTMKSDGTLEEHELIVRWMKTHKVDS